MWNRRSRGLLVLRMPGGQLQAEGWLADMEVEREEKAQSDGRLRGEECCKPRQGTHRKRAFEIIVSSVGESEEIIFPLKEEMIKRVTQWLGEETFGFPNHRKSPLG